MNQKKIKSKMRTKSFKTAIFAAIVLVGIGTSCTDDNNDNPNIPTNTNVIKTGQITADETWTADKVYQLRGRVTVVNGATLTIQAGTVVKGEAGQDANASVLIIARGGKINAQGTSTSPIIFTSVADNIVSGQVASPNLNGSFSGLWGGVIVLGRAPISIQNGTQAQIEGIPPTDTNGLYGGSNPTDNSGILRYVSIRHGGTLIGNGNEINGLTLGGVGSGTSIDHIEVLGNLDDGVEWFGGTVNVSDLLVWNTGDDAFDVDQAYTGTINNIIGIGGAAQDHALEIDGPEGSLTGGFTMTNGTFVGYNDQGTDGGEYGDFRDGAEGSLSNLFFKNFSDNSDLELDDDVSSNNYKAGTLMFGSAWQFDVSHLTSGNLTTDDIFADKSPAGDAFSDLSFSTIVTTPTVGADASEFAGWTWGDVLGALDGL